MCSFSYPSPSSFVLSHFFNVNLSHLPSMIFFGKFKNFCAAAVLIYIKHYTMIRLLCYLFLFLLFLVLVTLLFDVSKMNHYWRGQMIKAQMLMTIFI